MRRKKANFQSIYQRTCCRLGLG